MGKRLAASKRPSAARKRPAAAAAGEGSTSGGQRKRPAAVGKDSTSATGYVKARPAAAGNGSTSAACKRSPSADATEPKPTAGPPLTPRPISGPPLRPTNPPPLRCRFCRADYRPLGRDANSDYVNFLLNSSQLECDVLQAPLCQRHVFVSNFMGGLYYRSTDPTVGPNGRKLIDWSYTWDEYCSDDFGTPAQPPPTQNVCSYCDQAFALLCVQIRDDYGLALSINYEDVENDPQLKIRHGHILFELLDSLPLAAAQNEE